MWPAAHYAALVAAALVPGALGVAFTAPRARPWRWLLLALAAGLLGFGSTGWRAEGRWADRLQPALEGRDIVLIGVVGSMPQVGATGTRFRLEVESAVADGRRVQVPARVALGWYHGESDDAATTADALQAGQRWRLPARLKQPHGQLNPHGFDTELWLWEQGVRATGYVRAGARGEAPQRLADAVAHPVVRLRQRLRDALLRQVDDPRAAGVLAALVVGDQAAIEREDWDLYRATGIAHLMSISGLHVTMFAWLAGGALAWAWRRSPGWSVVVPALTAGACGGLLAAAAYALLAGWGVPAQRTVLMLAIGVLWRLAGWQWPWLLVLLLAAVGVTALDPWSLLQPGFWLSFAAVGLLLASEAARAERTARGGWQAPLVALLRSQAVATLGLAPLSLVFFQQVSVVGFIANLVAIPLVTLLITPLALLGTVVPLLWPLAAALVQVLGTGLAWLAAWPFAVWSVAAGPGWAMASGLAAALLLLLPLPWRVRWLALPMLLPLLLPPVQRPATGRFEVLAADVGQGTAVLVRTRHHLLLYDTGPQYSRDNDAGQRVLLPLLRTRGEHVLHALVLSHRDIDHVGGAGSVMAALPPLQLLSSLEDGHPLRGLGGTQRRCDAGQTWQWDGVQFEVLHPVAGDEARARKPNALSCVLRVADGLGRSVLLAGDIEAEQEAALVQRAGDRLRSDILLVPHHGSRTSSTPAFLAAVQPAVAVVQAGYRSRYGHPAPDVMARYAAHGIPVVRTDRCGAWMWHDGASACTRAVRRRYWHWQAPESGASGTGTAPASGGTAGEAASRGGANVAISIRGEGKQ